VKQNNSLKILKFATTKKMIKKVPPHILFVCQNMISYAQKKNSSDDGKIIEVYYVAQL